jgi:hypothetical protein
MVAKKAFVITIYSYLGTMQQSTSKSTGTQVKEGNCQGILKKFNRSRGWSRSQKKYLRLPGA